MVFDDDVLERLVLVVGDVVALLVLDLGALEFDARRLLGLTLECVEYGRADQQVGERGYDERERAHILLFHRRRRSIGSTPMLAVRRRRANGLLLRRRLLLLLVVHSHGTAQGSMSSWSSSWSSSAVDSIYIRQCGDDFLLLLFLLLLLLLLLWLARARFSANDSYSSSLLLLLVVMLFSRCCCCYRCFTRSACVSPCLFTICALWAD